MPGTPRDAATVSILAAEEWAFRPRLPPEPPGRAPLWAHFVYGFRRGGCRGLGGSIEESFLPTFFSSGLGEEGVCSSVNFVISDVILLLTGPLHLDLNS